MRLCIIFQTAAKHDLQTKIIFNLFNVVLRMMYTSILENNEKIAVTYNGQTVETAQTLPVNSAMIELIERMFCKLLFL